MSEWFFDYFSNIPGWFWSALFFIYGAIIGSFLNVCIYRIPLKKEVVRTPSFCPHCGEPVRWYLNIPIISWLVLRGKTSCCGSKLSLRYPLVELLYALYALLAWHYFGLSAEMVRSLIFGGIMLVLIFIDWEHMLLPNILTIPGTIIGFIFVFAGIGPEWTNSILAASTGAGIFLLIALGYRSMRGIEGLGMGDVKLMLMVGAFLGLPSILFVVVLGSVSALIYGLIYMAITGSNMKVRIPFGTFLGAVSLLLYFWGPLLSDWYMSLIH